MRSGCSSMRHRVARLNVLGEHEHADVGMLGPDPLRGDEALVGVRRRHADVGDCDVGPFEADVPEEALGVLRLADDVDACLLEEVHDPLAREHRVLCDDYAHGSSARSVRGSIETSPPRAPTRSVTCVSRETRSEPSSSTSTTRRPSSCCTRTST